MLAVHHPVRPPKPTCARGRSIEVSPVASNRISNEKAHSPQRQRRTPISCHIPIDTTTEKTKVTTPPPPPPLSSPALPTPSSRSSSPSVYHPSSASYDYFDSPPSPPQSLEDQVHVAYALDDIHLAKVLLLKLKGIDVSGDDDPRIAAVTDEDFDFCFVPNGRLVDGLEEMKGEGMREERIRREQEEREQERRRQERLKECEKKEKRRLREERELAWRKREDQRREEDESLRHQQRKRATSKMTPTRIHSSPARSLVSYKLASTGPGATQSAGSVVGNELFMYNFMVTTSAPPSCSTPSRVSSLTPSTPLLTMTPATAPKSPSASSFPRASPRSQSHPHTQYLDRPYSHHPETSPRTVTFGEVLTSIQGPLFPCDRKPNTNTLSTSSGSGRSTLVGSAYSHCSIGPTPSDGKRRRERNNLLESLLKVVEWEDGERRRRKGKGKAENSTQRPKVARKDSGKSIKLANCTVCSSAPSSTSTSTCSSPSTVSSSSSRLSWLSFSSAASLSSLATTPSSSSFLVESPTSPIFGKKGTSWFSSSVMQPKPSPQKSCPHTHLIPIAASESPLPIPVVKTRTHMRNASRLTSVSISSNPLSSQLSNAASIACVESAHTPTPLAEYAKTEPMSSNNVVTVMRTHVLKLFELAKGFQDAYVNATVLSVTSMAAAYEPDRTDFERRTERRKGEKRKRNDMNVKPSGERVMPQDLKKFLGSHIRRSSSSSLAMSRYQQHRYHLRGPSDAFVLQPYAAKVVPPLPPILRTTLPETPRYKTHFKPVHQPCRSPFRLRSSSPGPSHSPHIHPTHPYSIYHEDDGMDLPPPPKSMFSPVVIPAEEAPHGSRSPSKSAEKIVRVRAVENPVCLRVKAACRRYLDSRAGDHFRGGKGRIPVEEGPLPVMRDGSLGGGGERLMQVVFEGVGRSRLVDDEDVEVHRTSEVGTGRKCFDLSVFEDSDFEDEMTDEEEMEMVEFMSTRSNSPYHSVHVQVSFSEKRVQQMQRGRQRERGGRAWGP